VSWAVLFLAFGLGWVLLWALGWSIDLGVDDGELPAHAMWRECPGLNNAQLFPIVGIGLLAVAGVKLLGRARRRGGWWQIGLWAGLVVIADALLMLQYLRFLPAGCD
jgi:hypothetical protein